MCFHDCPLSKTLTIFYCIYLSVCIVGVLKALCLLSLCPQILAKSLQHSQYSINRSRGMKAGIKNQIKGSRTEATFFWAEPGKLSHKLLWFLFYIIWINCSPHAKTLLNLIWLLFTESQLGGQPRHSTISKKLLQPHGPPTLCCMPLFWAPRVSHILLSHHLLQIMRHIPPQTELPVEFPHSLPGTRRPPLSVKLNWTSFTTSSRASSLPLQMVDLTD